LPPLLTSSNHPHASIVANKHSQTWKKTGQNYSG
jgi:hypothetical protein